MSFESRETDPLAEAKISVCLRKAGKNTWFVEMRAEAKGFIPGSEQFVVTTEEEIDATTDKS